MKPVRLTMSGIGSFAEPTTFDLDALGSLAGIVGLNGAGKTTAIEGAFIALYARSVARGGNIYTAMRDGAVEAMIRLEFQHGGQSYAVERRLKRTDKTKHHEAWLTNGTQEPLAGPKSGDVDARIATLIGSAEVALATWFQTQKGEGDLCAVDPADRRAVFGELLGFSEDNRIAERAKARAGNFIAKAEMLEGQIAGARDFDAEIRGAEGELADLRSQQGATADAIAAAECNLEAARAALRDSEGGDDALRAQLERHEQAEAAVIPATQRLARLRTDRAREEETAGKAGQARAEIEEAGRLRGERADLQAKQSAFRAYETWQTRERSLDADVTAKERRVKDLEGRPGLDPETVAKAASLDALTAEYRTAKGENEARANRNAQRDERVAALRSEIAARESERKQAHAKLAKRPETPFGDQCSPCPLMKDYAALPATVERLGGEIEERQAELTAIGPNETLEDLADLIAKGAEARTAAATVKAAESAKADLEQARQDLIAARDAAIQHSLAKPADKGRDTTADLAATQSKLDRLAGAEERLRTAEAAAQRLASIEAELPVAELALSNAQQLADTTRGPAESARAALQNREEARKGARAAVANAEAKLKTTRESAAECDRQIARAEERIASTRRDRDETERKRAEAAQLRAKGDRNRALQEAFGPKGIQAILIDRAAPELEGIADRMMQGIDGGAKKIQIATQAMNAKGEAIECFDIMVSIRNAPARDVYTYSGGEERIIRTILRLAVAEWIARLRGERPETLLIDEGFDVNLDDAARAEMIRLLTRLGQDYERVMVITHSPEIMAALPSTIRLRNVQGFSQVERGAAA